ncbi:MAG: VOC family protein [Thermoanaerobaculia bacterium]|nr:VOC family protein [Thermoanaerobaculia bacterium]
MKIVCIAGFASITKDPAASRALYLDTLGLPLEAREEYLSVDGFEGAKHFGVWPLRMAAQSCFGSDVWPSDVPEPDATVEFELADVEAVRAAVDEMKADGHTFVHDVREEPWGQTVARFLSPEGVLIGLTYSPWLHE